MLKNNLIILFLGIILFFSTAYIKQEERTVIPIDAKLEYNNALDRYRQGNYEDAIASLRTAIRICPDYIDAYYNLGAILDYLNQTDEAISVYKQILNRDEKEFEAVYKIAKLAIKSGDKVEASRYIALIPASSSYFIKGKELMQQYNLTQTVLQESKKSNVPQTSSTYLNVTSPTGIASDVEGNIYIASFADNAIIKVSPEGKRMIFFKNNILKGPISIVFDSFKNMYIANYNANNILKLSKNGSVEVFLTNTPQPYSLHISQALRQ